MVLGTFVVGWGNDTDQVTCWDLRIAVHQYYNPDEPTSVMERHRVLNTAQLGGPNMLKPWRYADVLWELRHLGDTKGFVTRFVQTREIPCRQDNIDMLITYFRQIYQLASVMNYPSMFVGEIQIIT